MPGACPSSGFPCVRRCPSFDVDQPLLFDAPLPPRLPPTSSLSPPQATALQLSVSPFPAPCLRPQLSTTRLFYLSFGKEDRTRSFPSRHSCTPLHAAEPFSYSMVMLEVVVPAGTQVNHSPLATSQSHSLQGITVFAPRRHTACAACVVQPR